MDPELQSTPASRRISASRSFSVYSADKDDDFVKEELSGARVHVLGVDSFLAFTNQEELWNHPEWKRRFNELKLDANQATLQKEWFETQGAEIKQYPPFCGWVNHLIGLFDSGFEQYSPRGVTFLPLGQTDLPVTPGYADGKDVKAKAKGKSSSIRPDSACVLTREAGKFRKWSQVLVPIEFKKKYLPTLSKEEGVNTPASTSSSRYLEVTPDTTSSRRRTSAKRTGSVLEENEPQPKKARTSVLRIQSQTTPADPPPNSSSPSSQGPIWADVQLARYAMETLAAVGDRTHVFGLAVKRPEITLWYFDRCGAVRTQPLNVEDPSGPDFLAFIKFLSALVYMEDDNLGFNSSFASSSEPKQVEMRANLSQMSIQIPGKRASLELQEGLERRARLVGRATLVYKALMGDEEEEKRVPAVIKLAWQHVRRKSEYEILQELYEKPDADKYVVKVFFAWDGPTVSSMRDKFGEPKPEVDHDRILRYAVFEYLPPVTELSQPFHIPYIGWSVLQSIKFLRDAGWFHRDISVGNIGYEPLDCQGVLVKLRDFDLSKEIGKSSGAPHWTGTVPFMSIELLENPEAEHKVGFEVEAMVWTLLWIVRVYTDGKDPHAVEEHPLVRWFSTRYDLLDLADHKKGYLQKGDGFTNNFYKERAREMKSLAREWHRMREVQLQERDTVDNARLISEEVYGMPGFERIENWMKSHGWNTPEITCSCKEEHCALI